MLHCRLSSPKALWLSIVAGSLLASHDIAWAQDACIPNAVGVPGQPGPPAWWGGGSGPMDDPRWQGALSYGHAGDDVQMRALRYVDGAQTYLVLSWDVKADAGPATAGEDYLYVGFWDPVAGAGNVIRISRTATATVTDGAFGAALDALMYYRDSTTAGAWQLLGTIPPAPAWLQNDTLLDATCAAGPPPTCTQWAIRLRVPIDAAALVSNPSTGVPLPGTFRIWYEMHVETAGPSIVRYKWPASAASVTDFPTLAFPDPAVADQWNDASIGAGPCAGGVAISSGQIFTGAASNEITTVTPNVFHARPTNNTGGPIAGDAVRARFRIANWGSVLFDSPEWLDINPSSPSCASATGAAAAVADGSDFDLTCSWTLTPEQQCAYRPADYVCSPMPEARNAHQCILVELSSTTGVFFSRASAWRNMNFVVASTFEREATISIRGLPDLPGSDSRDVFLYVTTHNMPAPPARDTGDDLSTDTGGNSGGDEPNDPGGDEPNDPGGDQPNDSGGDQPNDSGGDQPNDSAGDLSKNALHREKQQPKAIDDEPKAIDEDPRVIRPVGTKEGARWQAMLREGEATLSDVAAAMATYVVRVYYDTGERVTKGTTSFRVLEPMPSFGYFVMHDGEIEGWRHWLDGAVEIAPGFYELAVPQSTGRATVKTSIEATEIATCPWWWWLLAAIAVLILLIVLWRRLT